MADIILSGLHLAGHPDDSLTLSVNETGGWIEVTGVPELSWPERALEVRPHLADVPAWCEAKIIASQGDVWFLISRAGAPPPTGAPRPGRQPEGEPLVSSVKAGEASARHMLRAGERLWLWSTGIALTVTLTANGSPARIIFAEGEQPPFDAGQGEILEAGETITRTVPRSKRLWLLGAT